MQPPISATGNGCCRCIGTSPWRSKRFRRFMERARPFNRAAGRFLLLAPAIAFFLLGAGRHTDAHKPVTSKYDYNRDVFPLLREHCSRCHVKGGPGPMSLMTYTDAVPWAVSIRDERSAGRMPPWAVDPTSPPVHGGQPSRSLH